MPDHSNDRYAITILARNIFLVRPTDGVEIDTPHIRELRTIFLRFSEDKPFAVLLDATGEFTVTDEARALLASKEFTDKRKAAAFVTPGLVNRLIGNFFIQVNKPASPTKLFNDEAEAFQWLKQQMKQYE